MPSFHFQNSQVITQGSVHRLGFAAGVMQMSGEIRLEVQTIVKNVIEQIMVSAIDIAEHQKRIRITSEDIVEAIRVAHEKIPFLVRALRSGDEGEVKRCPLGKSNTLERKVKFFQKQSGCVHFSRSGFERLVREIVNESGKSKEKLQFSKDAIGVLQLTIEAYLVRLMSSANLMVVHAERKTLLPKDLHIANVIGNTA